MAGFRDPVPADMALAAQVDQEAADLVMASGSVRDSATVVRSADLELAQVEYRALDRNKEKQRGDEGGVLKRC